MPRSHDFTHTYTQVCVQLPTYADNVALPAFARCTPPLQQSTNISCPPGLQQQICSSGFAAVSPCLDRRTDTVPFHRSCFAHFAGSVRTAQDKLCTTAAVADVYLLFLLGRLRNADIHRITNQPPLSSIIKSRRLTFFGYLARMDKNADASQAIFEPPPENWKRLPGRPRTTWIKNIL